MKDIDNIVKLYETIDKNISTERRYYYIITGQSTSFLCYTIKPIKRIKTKDGIRIRIGRGVALNSKSISAPEWQSENNREIYPKHPKDYEEDFCKFSRINENDVDIILKNNISSVDDWIQYKASKIIKNSNSTMMDVLCAFGDL